MLGQIGNWDGQVDVGFGPEMLSWLDRQGTGRCVTLDVFDDLSFLIQGDASGFKVGGLGVRMGYRYHVGVPHDEAGAGGVPLKTVVQLPRFMLHEVRIGHGGDGEPLTGTIDDFHLLPWPKLRSANCKAYLVADVLSRDIYLRVLSALRSGSDRLGNGPPDRLRALMPRGLWADALDRARAQFARETQPQNKAA